MNPKLQFIEWLKKNEPVLYRDAVMNTGNSGVGAWYDSVIDYVTTNVPKIVDTGTKTAQALLAVKQQEQAQKHQKDMATLQLQIEKANASIPPAPTPNYAPIVQQSLETAKGFGAYMPLIVGAVSLFFMFNKKR